MKKVFQLLLVALFLIAGATSTLSAQGKFGAMKAKMTPKPKAKPQPKVDNRTQSQKAADYRKQQGLDVRSARPKNGDVKGAKKREDADEAAEAARAKGFNAKTSTPVDKSKSKVERMTGTTPTNINKSTQVTGQPNAKLNPANPSSSGKTPKMATKPGSAPVDKSKSKVERMTGTTPTSINKSTQVTGQPNAKLNPANPSSSGKTPSMVNSSRTSTPVDKSKPKTERLTGEKNAGSLPPKLDKVTNGPPVKNKSQAEKGAERNAAVEKDIKNTPKPLDNGKYPPFTAKEKAKKVLGKNPNENPRGF